MIYFNGKKVAELYHHGKKVLQQYHNGHLVFSGGDPYAYGGYIKDGLVLQLDCGHYDVADGGWKDIVKGQIISTEPSTLVKRDDGGLSVDEDVAFIDLASQLDPTCYLEVCVRTGGEIETGSGNVGEWGSIMVGASQEIYSCRVYSASAYNQAVADHNRAMDLKNFDHSVPTNAICLNGGEPIQLFGGDYVELNKN